MIIFTPMVTIPISMGHEGKREKVVRLKAEGGECMR